MKMGQSTPVDRGVQGRYREVLTRKGMRNAKYRNVSGTSSRARQTRSPTQTGLPTTVSSQSVPLRIWQSLQERWRIDAGHHGRNCGRHVTGQSLYHYRSIAHRSVSMAASETHLHTHAKRQKSPCWY